MREKLAEAKQQHHPLSDGEGPSSDWEGSQPLNGGHKVCMYCRAAAGDVMSLPMSASGPFCNKKKE